MPEDVLVLHNKLLKRYLFNSNSCFLTKDKDLIYDAILKGHLFIPRVKAESDYNYKQVIPYIVIRQHNNYLLLKRTEKQTEQRLHNKYSLGIGGHINPEETKERGDIIIKGLYRELKEEIFLPHPYTIDFIGVINDESDSVSKVHLGMLHLLNLESPYFKILEKENMSGQWVQKKTLYKHYDKLERWSQIVLHYFINRGMGFDCKRKINTRP